MRHVSKVWKNHADLPRTAGSYEVSCSGRLILSKCEFNPGFLFRARGLLGRNGLEQWAGILLRPCNSIHMLFMKFAIDAVFLDQSGFVLHICQHLPPWRFSPIVWRSAAVLEMATGIIAARRIRPGAQLTFKHLPRS